MPRRTNHHRQLRSILHSPVLFRQLLQPLEAALRQVISEEKEKSWFPQLPILAHLMAGIFFHVQQLRSLRELLARLEMTKNKGQIHGIKFKLSTFSHANNSARRLQVLREVFSQLVASASGLPSGWRRMKNIAALDSTLLSCVPSAQWASYRKNVNACKGHLLFDLERSIPKQLVLSTGRLHDSRCFEQFLEVGWTYVVDRAYNNYSVFDKMTDRGIYFVCLLKVGSTYREVTKLPVTRAQRKGGVIHDRMIRLGNGPTQMTTDVRWVRFQANTGQIYDYITNRLDLSPLTVAQLYHARWAIETFFKWLKRTLRMERSLGRSAEALEIHVLTTLILDLLLKILVGLKPQTDHLSVNTLRSISEHIFVLYRPTLKRLLAMTAELHT